MGEERFTRRLMIVVACLLALTVLTPGIGGPGGNVAAQDEGDEVTLEIRDFAFVSDRIEIPVGTTVTWTNSDGAPHTVTADDEAFSSEELSTGDSFSFTFDEVGEFAYHCAIHPRMTGLIVVVPADAATPEATSDASDEADEDEPSDESPEDPAAEPGGEPTIVGGATNGSNAMEFIGRIDARGDDLTVFGYLTQVAGLDQATLFTDADPAKWSVATARFTFFGTATVTSRIGNPAAVSTIDAAGSLQFFVNSAGGQSFDVPEGFLSGTIITEADVSFHLVQTTLGDDAQTVSGDAALVWTNAEPFVHEDETVQLGKIDGRHRLTLNGVVADGDDDRSSISMAGSSISIAAAPTATATAAEATPEAEDAAEITVELGELNDSGMSGSATLRADGDETVVTIDLDGAEGDHPAHIHEGTCNDLDPNPAFPLEQVDADGQSETTVGISVSDLQQGQFAINVHRSDEEIGVYVACGNIE